MLYDLVAQIIYYVMAQIMYYVMSHIIYYVIAQIMYYAMAYEILHSRSWRWILVYAQQISKIETPPLPFYLISIYNTIQYNYTHDGNNIMNLLQIACL